MIFSFIIQKFFTLGVRLLLSGSGGGAIRVWPGGGESSVSSPSPHLSRGRVGLLEGGGAELRVSSPSPFPMASRSLPSREWGVRRTCDEGWGVG